MENPAFTADIESRWRTLTESETSIADTRLDDAWIKLKRDIPDLQARMVSDEDLSSTVVRVLADAVIRLLQSLERRGLRKGAVGIDDGSASWELDASIRTDLYFTESELGDLSPTGGAGGAGRARAYSVIPG